MEFTFLICSERSGSNLITRMMDSHPMYCGPSPLHVFRLILDNRSRYGDLSLDRNWKTLIDDFVQIFDSKIGVWKTALTQECIYKSVEERSLLRLFRFVYEQEAKAHGKTRLFVKENHTYRYLPYLLAGFPGAKFVYMVRDPRDMSLSWKLSDSLRGCVLRAAEVWREDQAKSIRAFQWLNEFESMHLIHYEQLIADTPATLESLCSFLNVPFSEAMIRYQDDALTVENANQTTVWQNIKKPVMQDNFNKYKTGLSAEEIMYVESLCSDEMHVLGYERDFDTDRSEEVLANALAPLELHDKPGYKQISDVEKEQRARRLRVERHIKERPAISLIQRSSTHLVNAG